MIHLNRFLFCVLFFSELSMPCHAYTQEINKSTLILDHLEETTGEYQGEIRLQTPDGLTDRLLIPDARLTINIKGDELLLNTPSDLLGEDCNSKISSVRELIKYPQNEPEALKAVFDFNPGHCSNQSNPNTLLILVRRELSQGLILETLFVRNPFNLEIHDQINQKELIHGYFQKSNSRLAHAKG